MKFEIRFGGENAGLTVEKGAVQFHSQYSGTTTPMTIAEWHKLIDVVEALIVAGEGEEAEK